MGKLSLLSRIGRDVRFTKRHRAAVELRLALTRVALRILGDMSLEVFAMPMHPGRIPIADLGREDAMRRWPRLTAHLIAESLGYFTPEGAAGAVLSFKRNQEHWCEWYMHMAAAGRKPILQVGAETLRRAIRFRRMHCGYMSSYELARKIIQRYQQTGESPLFMSW